MKIFVKGEFITEKIEITIFENQSLKINKNHIFETLKERNIIIKIYFQIIFGNFILDDDKKFWSFYIPKKNEENDEIWVGRIEKFMKEDDVIVELLVTGFAPSLVHLIVNKNISISNLKSMIIKIIPNFVNVWDMKGNQMKNDEIIQDIDLIGGYYKLIISRDDINDKLQTFDYHSKFHDEFFCATIFEKFEYMTIFQGKQKNSDKLILLVDKCRKILSLSPSHITDCRILDSNLSALPVSYINSRFLFSMDMANRIWEECCDQFWKLRIDKVLTCEQNRCAKNFKQLLCLIIVHYVKSREKLTDRIDRSIRNILIDTIEHFVNFFIDHRKDEVYLLKLFSKYFLIGCYDNMTFNRMGEAWMMKRKIFHVKLGTAQYSVIFDVSPAVKIIDMKKAICQQTNIPVGNLFCVQYGSNKQPSDDSIVGDYTKYFFENLVNMDNFDNLKELGKGGFGQIYCNTEFALKKPKNETNKEIESIYRDISMNSMFQYLNCLERYVNLALEDETVWLVMKYLNGGSLRAYIEKSKTIPEKEISKICFQLLKQIKEIHALNIIHQDINCDNIVLDQYGNARIIDYGISKCINETSAAQLKEDLLKEFVGNRRYCAPEYLESNIYTKRIDIWSLGAVVITMATGIEPYYGNPDCVVVKQIVETKTIKYFSRKCSQQLKDFIKLCLTPNPDERPNADELMHSEFIQNYLKELNKK